jgi:hypothetical protein
MTPVLILHEQGEDMVCWVIQALTIVFERTRPRTEANQMSDLMGCCVLKQQLRFGRTETEMGFVQSNSFESNIQSGLDHRTDGGL